MELMDSDGDLFTVDEWVMWSYEPGNALLTWPVTWFSALNKIFTNVFLLLCKMYFKIRIIKSNVFLLFQAYCTIYNPMYYLSLVFKCAIVLCNYTIYSYVYNKYFKIVMHTCCCHNKDIIKIFNVYVLFFSFCSHSLWCSSYEILFL